MITCVLFALNSSELDTLSDCGRFLLLHREIIFKKEVKVSEYRLMTAHSATCGEVVLWILLLCTELRFHVNA